MRAPGTRRSPMAAARRRKCAQVIYAPAHRRRAILISSRITSRSIISSASIRPRHAAQRAAHLKDYDDLLADIAAGRLPAVVFYKPQGNLNQHAGYASVAEGDAHIADLVARLRASPQWKQHGDRDHLRRIRRCLGSRRSAAGRPAGSREREFRR